MGPCKWLCTGIGVLVFLIWLYVFQTSQEGDPQVTLLHTHAPFQSDVAKLMEDAGFAVLVKSDTKPSFWVSLHRPNDDTPRAPMLYKRHYYEVSKTDQLKQFLDPRSGTLGKGIFLDIGANIGWFSLYAAAMERQVISFEPNPDNLARLKLSIELNRLNDRISVQPFGVGAEVSKMWFAKVATNQGMGHFVSKPEEVAKLPKSANTSLIQIKPVDDVLNTVGKPWQQQVVLVKIDVEGLEDQVLLGLLKCLARDKPFAWVEFDNRLREDSYYDAIHLFIALGYALSERGQALEPGMSTAEVKQWFLTVVVPNRSPVDVLFKPVP